MKGLFVVFEGGEGSGKSTQARLLYARMQRQGIQSILLHEPGGTSLGEQIRRLLTAERGEPQRRHGNHQNAMAPLAELLLFSAARAELTNKILRPTLDNGQIVICDRFTPSTVAYQGYGRGLPGYVIDQVNELAIGGLKPDLVILLDMPPEDALRRVSAQTTMLLEEPIDAGEKRRDNDGQRRFEQEPLRFHHDVRRGYLAQAQAEPQRWLVIDGTLKQADIEEIIWGKVESLLKD